MSHGAGIGETWSRGPACGDATVEAIMSASLPILCASSGSDPQRGPSSALRRAPFYGDALQANATCRRRGMHRACDGVSEAGA
jgi:hypothetical protein